MCGRLSQYTGLHEFVDALSMPNALVNLVGEQPQRYNVAPSTAVTTLRLEGDALVAQPIRWGWRPFWARDRVAPINARVEKVAHGRFFSAAWRHRALCPVSGWFSTICSARSGGVAGSSHSRASSDDSTTGRRSWMSTMPPSASAVMITNPW